MDKKTQDLAWTCLPKEVRDFLRKRYEILNKGNYADRISELNVLFGHRNLTSVTDPEEMLIVSRSEVQEAYNAVVSDKRRSVLFELFGDKCLPDKELNEDNFAKSKPVFKIGVGDKVRIVNDVTYNGKIGKVLNVNGSMIAVELDDVYIVRDKCYFEPYTEPETKDNMEEKELNLCELLKGCEREKFYSLIDGDVKLKQIEGMDVICSRLKYHLRGHLADHSLDGHCLLYPSRALYEKYPLDPYSAWMEWKREKDKEFKAIKGLISPVGNYWELKVTGKFHTHEEATQGYEAVKDTLHKFHENHK